ncbi:tRNA-dependent cyclodipeptide synthase [Nocardia vermiculata]|uniref:Cyclodipeptide synthase n=1 Tax=Nocardia vermiculata TaxID=257274 RepID=A0A846XVA3_9NOCA|nr:tRNA-dependent cyclodipeptide synthase [Nocardia vermiculata]NKY49674.1 tRNA-dependent cyclodipeptide synthase [Nocardia vermiculata]
MTLTATTPVGSASHKAAFDLKGRQYDYADRSAILLVSVGADYHEGEKFGATIDLLNRSGFGQITVAVADTLQRHNLGIESARAYAESRRRGDQWVARNRPLLDLLTADTDILRWDDALVDPEYPRALRDVRAAYTSNTGYRAAIDTTIDRFVARRDGDGADLERVRQRCLAYLLEEVPIIQPLWAAQGYDFVVYPQQISAAMQATRELFVADGAAWLPLRFKKRRSAR